MRNMRELPITPTGLLADTIEPDSGGEGLW